MFEQSVGKCNQKSSLKPSGAVCMLLDNFWPAFLSFSNKSIRTFMYLCMDCLLWISDFEALAIDASVNQFFRPFLWGDTIKGLQFIKWLIIWFLSSLFFLMLIWINLKSLQFTHQAPVYQLQNIEEWGPMFYWSVLAATIAFFLIGVQMS